MASTPYNKPAISVEDQIQLLIDRGLIIDDVVEARHYLTHVGFYRLAGYWLHLQDDPENHIFKEGTSFVQVVELYEFDRELRVLLIDAIERIEVSLKAVISNQMSIAYTPIWYSKYEYARNQDMVDKITETVNEEIERRKADDFVKHHDNTYGADQYMPAWKVMEILSLGALSRLYENIDRLIVPEKRTIAKLYGLPDSEWLENYLQVINTLRNLCAHHSRLCYNIFTFPPRIMGRAKLRWILGLPTPGTPENRSVYYQLCAVAYLLQTANPKSNFSIKIKNLLAKYPGLDLGKMGFYNGWENESLWQ